MRGGRGGWRSAATLRRERLPHTAVVRHSNFASCVPVGRFWFRPALGSAGASESPFKRSSPGHAPARARSGTLGSEPMRVGSVLSPGVLMTDASLAARILMRRARSLAPSSRAPPRTSSVIGNAGGTASVASARAAWGWRSSPGGVARSAPCDGVRLAEPSRVAADLAASGAGATLSRAGEAVA